MSWICITSLRYHYGSVLLFHILIDSLICIIRGGKKNNYFGERKEGRGVCALGYWVSEKRCREWTRSFVSSEKLSEKPGILNIIHVPALYYIKLPVLSQTFFWLYRCLVNLNKKNCYKNQNWKWPILPYYHYHHHIVKLNFGWNWLDIRTYAMLLFWTVIHNSYLETKNQLQPVFCN